MLLSPQNYVIPRAFSLTEPCSNNVAEYNALLIEMQLTEEIRVRHLEASMTLNSSLIKSESTKFEMKT